MCIFAEKRLQEKLEIERNLEMKEHALQKAQLYIKELEYAKDTYMEFQELAKVLYFLICKVQCDNFFLTFSHKNTNYQYLEI